MAAVQLACPLCQGILEIDSSLSGRQVACPLCQGLVTIPVLELEGPPQAPIAEPPAPAGLVQLGCPLCAGAFQITPEMEGLEVACPHCHGLVTIPHLSGPPPGSEQPPHYESPAPFAPQTAYPSPAAYEPLPVFERSPATGAFDGYPTDDSTALFGTGMPHVVPGPEPTAPATTPAPTEHEDRNLYPPGFDPPADTRRPSKPQKKRIRDERTGSAAPQPTANVAPDMAVNSLFPSPAGPAAPLSDGLAASGRESFGEVSTGSTSVDALLPPGAGPSMPLRPVLVSSTSDHDQVVATSPRAAEPIVIPTEDGRYVAVHEPVKTVGKRGQEVALRRLTPEEKARRRRTKNLVMGGFCLVVLALVFFVLKNLG